MKYIFIVNGNAGSGSPKEQLQNAIKEYDGVLDYEIYETAAPKDATRFVKEYCVAHPEKVCFVACGGDGTINEVASGLVGTQDKPMAVLAFGSGNDFVKYYKGRNFTSIRSLVNGSEHLIDILKVNDCYSINVCNFGFDSVVGGTANKIKEKGGKNPYVKGVVKAIFTARYNKIEVISDGEKISKKKMLLCTLANNHYVGGQYFCAPNAKNDDGWIDVCLFHTMTLFSFLKLLKPYTNGEHLSNPKFIDKLVYRRAKHVEVNAEKTIELCLDGEMLAGTHFEIDIIPNAIDFIIPEMKHAK